MLSTPFTPTPSAVSTQDYNKRIRLIMHLRTMGITDTNVLAAIERVPRDMFVPPTVKDQAWDDIALPIGCGQTISQPLVVAVMSAALGLTDRDRVLEIGTGCGYQSAVLSHLCRRVYTIERYHALARRAERHFEALKLRNITAVVGDGMKGWVQRRPGTEDKMLFHKIIVTAAAKAPPQALKNQLCLGGVMVLPVCAGDGQMLRSYTRETEDTFAVRDIMPVRFVPLLPDVVPDQQDAAQDRL